METLSLDGEWQLAYFPEADGMPLNPDELAHYQCPRIPANVPGNVELDLARSGEIPALPELMRGLTLTKLRKYECYDWWYLSEDLQEQPGVRYIHDYSRRDKDNNRERIQALHDAVADAVRKRRENK